MSKTVSRYNTHAEWYGEGLARSECKRARLREASFPPPRTLFGAAREANHDATPPRTQSGAGACSCTASHRTLGDQGHRSETTNIRVADVEDRMLKARTERQGKSLSDVIRQYLRRAFVETFPPKKRGRKVGPAPLQPGRTP